MKKIDQNDKCKENENEKDTYSCNITGERDYQKFVFYCFLFFGLKILITTTNYFFIFFHTDYVIDKTGIILKWFFFLGRKDNFIQANI